MILKIPLHSFSKSDECRTASTDNVCHGPFTLPCYSTERGERRSRRLRRRSGRSPPSGGLSGVGVGGGRVGLTPGVGLAARVYSLVCYGFSSPSLVVEFRFPVVARSLIWLIKCTQLFFGSDGGRSGIGFDEVAA